MNVTEGSILKKEASELESGNQVVAAVLFHALEEDGEDETTKDSVFHEVLSISWCSISKGTLKRNCFLNTAVLKKVLAPGSVRILVPPYLGLSKEFGDLLEDEVFAKVEYWMH